ncbi:DNA replication/repair protein RecF [uncultured Alsobacter sp.]|uniref:DNA replication/repair protein RecF n=1 Tax=uncultured Alsobacter sp. TaxID=1748258 RepID=UPI0025F6F49E|nr:DNA replication/repair protein RecF [uncultured Alsobacter sp.]
MTGLAPPRLPRVSRLMLGDFRSYRELDLAVSASMVALVGENGAGKTNVLEALSLLAAGRGLRRADLAAMARTGGPGTFSVSVRLDEGDGGHRLGTGTERSDGDGLSRRCRVDGTAVPGASAFAEHLRIVWLTPSLDGLFTGPAGDRRRFLDRLVLAVDAEHGTRVSALERSLRSRNRLLEEDRPDPSWLDAVEREVAETGVAVAAARRETVERLAGLIQAGRDETSPFPWAAVALDGALEAELATRPAVDVEDAFRSLLRRNRARDKAAGRAIDGPQASDLMVRHGPKDVPAGQASTGEQKALLIGLVLAHARLVGAMSGMAPLVLLDEIAAHLDPRRRAALFEALAALGSQVWMTGADPDAFRSLPAGAERFEVTPGRIAPISGP